MKTKNIGGGIFLLHEPLAGALLPLLVQYTEPAVVLYSSVEFLQRKLFNITKVIRLLGYYRTLTLSQFYCVLHYSAPIKFILIK